MCWRCCTRPSWARRLAFGGADEEGFIDVVVQFYQVLAVQLDRGLANSDELMSDFDMLRLVGLGFDGVDGVTRGR